MAEFSDTIFTPPVSPVDDARTSNRVNFPNMVAGMSEEQSEKHKRADDQARKVKRETTSTKGKQSRYVSSRERAGAPKLPLRTIPKDHHLCTTYDEILPDLQKFLEKANLNFAITLFLDPIQDTGIIYVGIFQDENDTEAEEAFQYIEETVGPYEHLEVKRGRPRFQMAGNTMASCGASIGLADWPRGGGTFGGYVVNDEGEVFALTCGHIFAVHTEIAPEGTPDKDRNIMVEPGLKVASPANFDHESRIQRAEADWKANEVLIQEAKAKHAERQTTASSKAVSVHSRNQSVYRHKWETLKNNGVSNFGIVTGIRELAAEEDRIWDYLLIKVSPMFAATAANRITGVSDNAGIITMNRVGFEEDHQALLWKRGRTSGVTKGHYNGRGTTIRGFGRFPGKVFTCHTVKGCPGPFLEVGDSGAWVASETGRVAGLAFAVADDSEVDICLIIPMAELLERIHEKFGLQLAILPTEVDSCV